MYHEFAASQLFRAFDFLGRKCCIQDHAHNADRTKHECEFIDDLSFRPKLSYPICNVAVGGHTEAMTSVGDYPPRFLRVNVGLAQ